MWQPPANRNWLWGDDPSIAPSGRGSGNGSEPRPDARALQREPATKIVEAVNKSLAEFTAGAAQADDITLVVAKRL